MFTNSVRSLGWGVPKCTKYASVWAQEWQKYLLHDGKKYLLHDGALHLWSELTLVSAVCVLQSDTRLRGRAILLPTDVLLTPRKKEINEPSFLLLILASIAACISQRLILTLLWFCAVWSNTRIAWPGVGWGMFYTAVKTTKSTFQTGREVEILLLSNTNHQTILQFFQYINF